MLVSALTLLAFAIGGYHPYAEDGGLYLAGVKRLLNPVLYPRSTAFALEPARLSLFAPAVAGIVRVTHIGLPGVLFVLHLLSIWATLFAAWLLATRCWEVRAARAAAVVLLACWLSLPVAGTALLLMDPYLTARSFSTPATLLAIVGALDMTEGRRRQGILLWAGSLALAAAMHPLMAAYALGATLILLCLRASRRTLRIGGTAAISCAAALFAAALQHSAKAESADYVRVALTRTYWFPSEWRWFELAGLMAPLAILAIAAWRHATSPGAPRLASETWVRTTTPLYVEPSVALARMALAAGVTAWIVAAIFARADSPAHLVARLQPLRVFQIVYLVMVLLLGVNLGAMLSSSRLLSGARRWAAAVLLLGGTMFAANRAAFPNSPHLELPWLAPRNPWVRAFLWIRESTPKDALFALDADYINSTGEDTQCFRAIAERSALPDYSKDGGEASIAPELTTAWVVGQSAQQNLSAPSETDAKRIAALRPLSVSWIVLESSAVTHFGCSYQNATVKVCRLP